MIKSHRLKCRRVRDERRGQAQLRRMPVTLPLPVFYSCDLIFLLNMAFCQAKNSVEDDTLFVSLLMNQGIKQLTKNTAAVRHLCRSLTTNSVSVRSVTAHRRSLTGKVQWFLFTAKQEVQSEEKNNTIRGKENGDR